MNKILLTLLISLGLSTSAMAENPFQEGTFTAPSASTVEFSDKSDFALGVAVDYGLGVSMEFKDVIDVSLGHAGIGADYKFFNYKFMPRSKYFSKRPLDFYIGAGLGYVWDDKFSKMREGFVMRTPIGADWQFDKEWSVYLSVSPAVNFQKEQTNNGVVTTKKDTEFMVIGTVGIRYHF